VSEHKHWAVLIPAMLIVSGATLLVLWIDASTPPSADQTVRFFWYLWLVVVLWGTWRFIEWRRDWFIGTNKRLLLFYGIPRRVAMMPLIKVTDMSYRRSVTGLVLGYGKYIMESAGQDQALSEINLVPHPDANYQAICTEIFGDQMGFRAADIPSRSDTDLTGTGGTRGSNPPEDPYSPRSRHNQWNPEDAPHAMPTRGRPGGSDSLYRSPDIIRRHRKADTGPIPIYPPPGADD
jgi:hypothetical protein